MHRFLLLSFLVLSINFYSAGDAKAQDAAPRQAVQAYVDAIRSMEFPARDQVSQKKLASEANRYLDLEALSKKALGGHWETASGEQKKEFMGLMGQLIELVAYPRSRGFMGDYEITYPEVTKTGRGYEVQSVIKQEEQGLDAEVLYHVYESDEGWKIDDVIVDGVSITEDLKYQFDLVVAESGFQGLLDLMKNRVENAQKNPAGA